MRFVIDIILVLLLIILFARVRIVKSERDHFIELSEKLLQELRKCGIL